MPAPRRYFLQLRYLIEIKGYRHKEFADLLGESGAWLTNKLCGRSPWTMAEAIQVCTQLEIPLEEMANYFGDCLQIRERRMQNNVVPTKRERHSAGTL